LSSHLSEPQHRKRQKTRADQRNDQELRPDYIEAGS